MEWHGMGRRQEAGHSPLPSPPLPAPVCDGRGGAWLHRGTEEWVGRERSHLCRQQGQLRDSPQGSSIASSSLLDCSAAGGHCAFTLLPALLAALSASHMHLICPYVSAGLPCPSSSLAASLPLPLPHPSPPLSSSFIRSLWASILALFFLSQSVRIAPVS